MTGPAGTQPEQPIREGKYARVERERRFLLAGPPRTSAVTASRRITDRYLPGTRLRLRRVDHLDSTGIGILAYCYGTMNRNGGDLRIAGACGKVLHLLQITRLDSVLPLCDSVEVACASLGAKPPG